MAALLEQRRAGMLLHITSLPGNYAKGDMGKEAHHFINFLQNAGVTVWQTLPLGVPHNDGSPYQCLSAHAGNPGLISLEALKEKGWLEASDHCDHCEAENNFTKKCLLTKAFYAFQSKASQEDKDRFEEFCVEKSDWLDDFALFMAFRAEFNFRCWTEWPEAIKQRRVKALREARERLKHFIEVVKFEQYIFFRQWHALKKVAEAHNVLLLGDIPIFVSYDSVDVWVNRKVFKLEKSGEMSVVAGVPPDYFSQTGQRWGNPHYQWKYLQKTGFKWWIQRLETQLELFDIVRIDHFRGLEAAWEIPSTERTAINGEWVKAPGKPLLTAIQKHFGEIPLVAEDLGEITEEVDQLRMDFNLPGMKILHFAFSDTAENPYLPHNYEANSVVYTGTHDNDTTLGWYNPLSNNEKKHIYELLGASKEAMPWALIQTALASVSNLAVIPLQDILELDSKGRMNTPGTTQGNWNWRFQWSQLTDDKAHKLSHLIKLFGR
ncbi:MAG: 4-alpha-glucanotransferase [Methylococcales bacterium]|nr:4-alpha-glucanotransferase [Methylococcales bacterium]